jgi:hypothetical protein
MASRIGSISSRRVSPALRDELGREPVEQLGMARALAEAAEVAGGPHEATAEVILPEPVDHHPRR